MITRAFRLATGRLPSAKERELGRRFLTEQKELLGVQVLRELNWLGPSGMTYNLDPATAAALRDFALAVFNLPGFLYVN